MIQYLHDTVYPKACQYLQAFHGQGDGNVVANRGHGYADVAGGIKVQNVILYRCNPYRRGIRARNRLCE